MGRPRIRLQVQQRLIYFPVLFSPVIFSFSPGVSAAIDLTPVLQTKKIPPGLVLAVRGLIERGIPIESNKTMVWNKEKFKQSDILELIATEDGGASGGEAGEGKAKTTASRKSMHCFIRLACLVGSDDHREEFGESRYSASRKELDTKATGSGRGIWHKLAADFRDKNLEVSGGEPPGAFF